jgi:hypothetical protein
MAYFLFFVLENCLMKFLDHFSSKTVIEYLGVYVRDHNLTKRFVEIWSFLFSVHISSEHHRRIDSCEVEVALPIEKS